MDKTITVSTESGEVVVRKLALGDYAELLRALKKLPAELGKFLDGRETGELQDMDLRSFLPHLPEIIADAVPEFAQVLAVPTDKDADFFLKGDLPDAIDVFVAVLELNDYNRVVQSIKKLTARKQVTPEATAKS